MLGEGATFPRSAVTLPNPPWPQLHGFKAPERLLHFSDRSRLKRHCRVKPSKRTAGALVRFYNKRGTAEQWIKEGSRESQDEEKSVVHCFVRG
jgi:hypothetical protein